MTQPFSAFLSAFPSQALSTLSPLIVLAIAGFFIMVGIILAFIFEYHWKTYGINPLEMLRVRFWYYIGSAVFGGGMLVFAVLYILSS